MYILYAQMSFFYSQIIDSHLPERKCSAFAVELTSKVVEICRSKAATDCARGGHADRTAEDSVETNVIPQHLVDQSEFECILCTG